MAHSTDTSVPVPGRRLAGQVALVTGGGSGIGAAIATLFAAEGARLAVCDRVEDTAGEVADRIRAGGGETAVFTGDVSAGSDADAMVAATVDHFGGLDVLVNCAGVTPRYAPAEFTFEQTWDWVVGVNLKGTYLMSRRAVQQMREQGNGGAIVNLASIYGLVGRPSFFGTGDDPYPASKGGIVILTKDMANAFGREGIRVNALCPAFIYTPLTKTLTEDGNWMRQMEAMQPLGRLGQPDEVARAALFLASAEASFITGIALPVDGGYTSQ